jgi:predicted GIY-YIG superfamily endonuclease
MAAHVYILRLLSGNLYIGATEDLKKRYQDHRKGRACRTTKMDPPVGFLYSETCDSFSEARKRGAQLKR